MEKITHEDKKLRAAIYKRVSTDEQALSGYGLAHQDEKLRAFIVAQDYTLDEKHIYKDEGFSGTLPVEKRPGLKALFEAAARKEFDVVIVYRLDRFGRRILLILHGVQRLAEYGVSFCSVTEPFDTTNAFGRYLLASLGALSELERETIKERMQGGRRMAAKSGNWVWGPPAYGLKLDKNTKKLKIIPHEAKWVKKFFEWVVIDRLSMSAIQKRANELKIPSYTRKRKRPELSGYWHKKSIARILSNPIYTGTGYFYRFKPNSVGSSRWTNQDSQYDESEWIAFQAPAIISQKLFDRCLQQLLKNKEMASRNLKYTYLFNKLLHCGKCGLKLFAGTKPPKNGRNMYKFYHGPRQERWRRNVVNSSRCFTCGDITERKLEPIWNAVRNFIENPEYMLRKLNASNKAPLSKDEIPQRLQVATKRLFVLTGRKRKLDHVYLESDTIDYKTYQKKLEEIKLEEYEVKKEIKTLNQHKLSRSESQPNVESAKALYEGFRRLLQNRESYENKAEILHTTVKKVTLYKEQNEAEVEFNVSPVSSAGVSYTLATAGVVGGLGDENVNTGHTTHQPFVFTVKLPSPITKNRNLEEPPRHLQEGQDSNLKAAA